MVFGLGKSASGTIEPLLMRWGLRRSDLSARVLDVLRALEAERADLAEQLQIADSLSMSDPLTGAFNRRGFLTALHRTMSEVERYATPAAVLYIDLDGLKALNDGYGHAAGDVALTQVGRLLTDSVRESDVVGRLGGDEFGVIMNHATAEEARAKALALSERINHTAIKHVGVSHRLSVSIGVHPIARVEDPEDAIARADEAMYADKHARKLLAQRFANF